MELVQNREIKDRRMEKSTPFTLNIKTKILKHIHTSEVLVEIITLAILFSIGTFFYSTVEGWSYLDSFYFSVTTLATVGFGDLYPTKPISKIFTIFYVFVGVGLVLYLFTTVSRIVAEKQRQRLRQMYKNLKNTYQGTDSSD